MITRSVLLPCDVSRAFTLFTERISEWWPPERRHTGDPRSTIVLDPGVGFFERDPGGRTVPLGQVVEWAAPDRLVLDWYPGTDPEHPTRVEVSFQPEPDGTRIWVRHGPTAASASLFPGRVHRYEASWDLVLGAVAAHPLVSR